MNQSTNSLEDKLKGRLHGYEAPPPSGAGGAILDQVNGGSGNSPWIITLALLLGVLIIGGGFYMTSMPSSERSASATAINAVTDQQVSNQSERAQASLVSAKEEQTSIAESAQRNSGPSVEPANDVKSVSATSPNPSNTSVLTTRSTEDQVELPSALASITKEDIVPVRNMSFETVALAQEEIELVLNEEATGVEDRHTIHQLVPKGLDNSSLRYLRQELSIDTYFPRSMVVASKRRRYRMYADLGVFFLYNHLQPNKNDGLIMENFETSGSFSLDRLSYYAEFGLKRDLSRKITLRAAAVANIFAQKYSFDIRDETSSSVQVSGMDENLLTPVFDRQTVSMDHFLLSAGLRLSTDLRVFKSDLNRLMLGMGYHHILNPEHTFEYDGATQRIDYPHQLTASFGFRKVVWQSDRGELSLLPVLRYGLLHKASESSALTIKPFSVGLTIGYGLK